MSLELNLKKSICTRVLVYHDNVHIANVYVNPSDINSMCEEVYMKTQNIDSAWYHNPLVECWKDSCRSSSIGDIFVIDGVYYKVSFIHYPKYDKRFTNEFEMKYVAQSDSSIAKMELGAAHV